MRNTRLRFCKDPTETVLQEGLQRYVLLTNEPALRQLAVCEQIKHGGYSGGRCNLNGTQCPTVDIAGVDLIRVGLLDELDVVAAADGYKYDHHILQCRWYGVFQDILQHIATVAQPQIIKQRTHDYRMAGIANRAVIESTDFPFQGVAKRPEPARGVERFVGYTIKRKLLPLFQRRHLAARAINDRFARLAVFVDDAIRAPGQVVVERVRRVLRERADPQLDAVENLKALRHVKTHDRHETWSEPTLRRESGAGTGGELSHAARACDILGQVEIMSAGGSGHFRDARRQMEGRGIEHGELSVQKIGQL